MLSQGVEELALQLPQNLILEVQVEDEEKGTNGIQHSLEIEIKWFDKACKGFFYLNDLTTGFHSHIFQSNDL